MGSFDYHLFNEGKGLTKMAPSYCLIPGAGSAGLTWASVRSELDGVILPVPDQPTVYDMAADLESELRNVAEPRVVVAASLGAMVALELARRVKLSALVLIAAGFGITVSESLLEWIAANPPDLLSKMAKLSVEDGADEQLIELVHRDFAARGQPVLYRHLLALADYKPEPLSDPPPTVVIWGEFDKSVPLADHVELAMRCHGSVAPLRQAAHMPFAERPADTVRWIRAIARDAR
jgi:pimeloyl-ACP methyl ester carboxylesterase